MKDTSFAPDELKVMKVEEEDSDKHMIIETKTL